MTDAQTQTNGAQPQTSGETRRAANAEQPGAKKNVKWAESPTLGLMETLYLPAIASGIGTTIRRMFVRNETRQYPEVEPIMPANYRGVHRLNRDSQGRVKCVACFLCQTACPANCISIEAAAAPKDDPAWQDRDKFPEKFEIDELRCIYCGMCEQACPVDAIELTSIYDLTGATREEMMFDKEKLLEVFDITSTTGKDPVRTTSGKLGPASEFVEPQATQLRS